MHCWVIWNSRSDECNDVTQKLRCFTHASHCCFISHHFNSTKPDFPSLYLQTTHSLANICYSFSTLVVSTRTVNSQTMRCVEWKIVTTFSLHLWNQFDAISRIFALVNRSQICLIELSCKRLQKHWNYSPGYGKRQTCMQVCRQRGSILTALKMMGQRRCVTHFICWRCKCRPK